MKIFIPLWRTQKIGVYKPLNIPDIPKPLLKNDSFESIIDEAELPDPIFPDEVDSVTEMVADVGDGAEIVDAASKNADVDDSAPPPSPVNVTDDEEN